MNVNQEKWLLHIAKASLRNAFLYKEFKYGDEGYNPLTEYLRVNKFIEPNGYYYKVTQKGINYLEEYLNYDHEEERRKI